MRPENMHARLFLDGGNQEETKAVLKQIGFLDGQTTNPTLIAKNPEAQKRLEQGNRFSRTEIFTFYRGVVNTLSGLMPKGSISIEVYADAKTSAEEMLKQGKEMFTWIPNAHIKFPTSREGLKAAQQAVKAGLRVNMTLVFSQEQAAAVYAATQGARKGQVFLSPFIGRLDDRGENGMDLIANVIRMYQKGDGHVEVLTASVRNIDHFLYALKLGSDIITAPFEMIKAWGEKGLPIPGNEYHYDAKGLKAIPFRELDLSNPWESFDIHHDLTDKGMERFSADWNALIDMKNP
jgi:transaldolase